MGKEIRLSDNEVRYIASKIWDGTFSNVEICFDTHGKTGQLHMTWYPTNQTEKGVASKGHVGFFHKSESAENELYLKILSSVEENKRTI